MRPRLEEYAKKCDFRPSEAAKIECGFLAHSVLYDSHNDLIGYYCYRHEKGMLDQLLKQEGWE